MKKLVINRGTLIDPKNNINSKLNLGIENGKIVEISREILDGDIEVDAEGLIICPGFVDIHMHEDKYIKEKDEFDITIFETMAKMGVTTAVGGNCGIGPDDILEYMDAVERLGIPINLGMLIPHASLRKLVGGDDKYNQVTSHDIRKMKEIAGELIDKGPLGISFGIEYIPGLNKEELMEISSVCSKDGKPVAAHVRGDADLVMDSLKEFIEIGRGNNIPIQVSHIGSMAGYGQMEAALSCIDEERSNGVEIGVDCYPYNAFSTKIGTTPFDDGFLERYDIDYDSVEIAQGKYKGQRCDEEIFKELRENEPMTMAIGHVMDSEDIDLALKHPNVVLASDGTLNFGQGHPRAAGSFPRLISEYVKKKGILSLDEAIGKMTYKPAENMNIDKGSLGLGDDADLLIFDYESIKDNASFEEPLLSPTGIEYVFIGGELVVRGKYLIDGKQGKLIRK